jgi:hypothetical protein
MIGMISGRSSVRTGSGGSSSSFIIGSGAPSNSLGKDTDSYFDRTGANIYGPKANGAWPAPTPITGNTDAPKGPQYFMDEVPSGAIDGTNTVYALSHVPFANSLSVFINGIRVDLNDYTLSGGQITFNLPPNRKVHVTYAY